MSFTYKMILMSIDSKISPKNTVEEEEIIQV